MKFLLDTCFFSELIRLQLNPGVAGWVGQNNETDFFISVLTPCELKKGIALLPASQRKKRLDEWFEKLRLRFALRTISLDLPVVLRWAGLSAERQKEGAPLPFADALLAATALTHGLVLFTRNTRDFEGTGIEVINPWS